MRAFPWAAAMRFGLGVLRLSPRHFWGMTPRELAAAFAAHGGTLRAGAPARDTLDEMMRRYPDG